MSILLKKMPESKKNSLKCKVLQVPPTYKPSDKSKLFSARSRGEYQPQRMEQHEDMIQTIVNVHIMDHIMDQRIE